VSPEELFVRRRMQFPYSGSLPFVAMGCQRMTCDDIGLGIPEGGGSVARRLDDIRCLEASQDAKPRPYRTEPVAEPLRTALGEPYFCPIGFGMADRRTQDATK
jgi:hypothetical protein